MLLFALIFSSTKPSTSYKCGKKHSRDGKKIQKTLCPEIMPALWTDGWCEVSTPPVQQFINLHGVGHLGRQEPSLLHQQLLGPHWHIQTVGTDPRQAALHCSVLKVIIDSRITQFVTFLLQPADLHSMGNKEWEMLVGVAPETQAEDFQSSSNCSYKRTSRTILSKFHQVSNTFQKIFIFSLMKQAIKLQGSH